MDSNTGRAATVVCWIVAIAAMASASTHAALGVAAVWSIPCALVVSVANAAWPKHRTARIVGVAGIAWQAALVIAYWPFADMLAAVGQWSIGGTPIPLHALVIALTLAVLALAFLALFVLPAIGLLRSLRAMAAVLSGEAPTEARLLHAMRGDAMLERAWREYLSHVRQAADGRQVSDAAARNFLNVAAVAEGRLRVDFFRHMPGMFTGIGIIGTFSGLILGLRAFRISDDAGVVQNSLNGLLQGVWESFLISAAAILLAILVTVVEKMLVTALARRFEMVARLLDSVHPLELTNVPPKPDNNAQRILAALEALVERLPSMAATAVSSGVGGDQSNAGARPASAASTATATDAGAWTLAIERLTARLDTYLAEHVKASALAQSQSQQALKTLSSRLEMVASSIEVSGRKTLEVMAARLTDAQIQMASRHQGVAEQTTDLVSRIETLCSFIQRDYVEPTPFGGELELPSHGDRTAARSPGGAASHRRQAEELTLPPGWARMPEVRHVETSAVHFGRPGPYLPVQPPFDFGQPDTKVGDSGRFGS